MIDPPPKATNAQGELRSTDNGPESWRSHHGGRIDQLIHTAALAGKQTLKYFNNCALGVETKADHSPVTAADREAESLIRDRFGEMYPDDSILGEEHPDKTAGGDYTWIIDPIDGTRSFICGVPLYSTLLALEHQGEPLAGIIVLPALSVMVVALRDHGAYYRGDTQGWSAARVSETTQLQNAVYVTSQVDLFDADDRRSVHHRMESRCDITRTWGDGYGYAMVATGRADVILDAQCQVWDVAPMATILSEAGGQFTDWTGESTVRGGTGLGSNGHLHDASMKVIRGED